MAYPYEACDQISDFCHQKLLRKMRRKIPWTDGRTDRGKTVYLPPLRWSGGIITAFSLTSQDKEYHLTSAIQTVENGLRVFSRVKFDKRHFFLYTGNSYIYVDCQFIEGYHHGRDRMVVGLTTI